MNIPEELKAVDGGLETGFYEGAKPSWLSANTVGGASITYNDATDNGGYAQLDTGTSAVSDRCSINGPSFQPDAYDAVVYEFEMVASNSDPSLQHCLTGFQADGDNYIQWNLQKAQMQTKVAGNIDNNTPNTTSVDPSRRRQFRVVWYVERELIEGFVDGIKVTEYPGDLGDGLPDPSLTYEGLCFTRTQDTSSNRTMDVVNVRWWYARDAMTR
jgi:hypothetical protein